MSKTEHKAIFNVLSKSLAVARDGLKEAQNFIDEVEKRIKKTPNDQDLGKEIRDFFNEKYKSDE